jgi:Flp pilus assembly pilin Flp
MLLRAWTYLQSRLVREDGATMVEYGLILAVIAMVAVVGAVAVGITTDAKFDEVDACIAANGC